MPNGMTRGAWGLSERWNLRWVAVVLLFTATWILWLVAIGLGLSEVGR
jgi:hypothetical protein